MKNGALGPVFICQLAEEAEIIALKFPEWFHQFSCPGAIRPSVGIDVTIPNVASVSAESTQIHCNGLC